MGPKINHGPITRSMARRLQQDLEELDTEGPILFSRFEWKPGAQAIDPEWVKPA